MDLPNELVAHIIEFVNDLSALRNLASTCRRMQHLAEPVLYRRMVIRTGAEAKHTLKSMGARPERAAALHVLNIPCGAYYTRDVSVMIEVTTTARSLRELMVESPSCNEAEFEDVETWRLMSDRIFRPFQDAVAAPAMSPPPLQNLRKLTLHLNGAESPYWTLDSRSLSIFFHPTLRDITISCMNLYGEVFTDITNTKSTPLKHLTLEECNISHNGLLGLLSLPKALETLYLGENCHNFRQFTNRIKNWCMRLFQYNPGAVLKALSQQKQSLKSLTYVTSGHHIFLGTVGRPKPSLLDAGFADFADFEFLEDIALIGSCVSFERAVLSFHPPPNLHELTVQSRDPLSDVQLLIATAQHGGHLEAEVTRVILKSLPFIRAPSASIPTGLKILNLVQEYDHLPTDASGVVITDERRNVIWAAAKALKEKRGIQLRVQYYYRGRYFPPLLYSEPRPRTGVIYDENTRIQSESG